ncbi:MAG: hypothetical protein JSU61_07605 [Fidelibacterota bacterium]|nr:MAG: hypothetical protein JSU61_07605 [Candidatus Neomarinimicrobiota bacterium]
MTKKTTEPPVRPNGIAGFIHHLLDKLYPHLDSLFLLRPVLFMPVWTVTVAGLSVGYWLVEPDFFWRVAWSWQVILVIIGVSLITGSAFIRAQLQEGGETEIKGHASVIAVAGATPDHARRLMWMYLGVGLALLLPGGWLTVLMGVALYAIWGILYGSNPVTWKGKPPVEGMIHLLAGAALFYLGLAASGADLAGSLNLAMPYFFGIASVAALIAITPGPRYPDDRPRPGIATTIPTIIVSAIMALVATIWGYQNGDPAISTAAVLALPFHAVALYYRREIDIVRTCRYSILLFVIFVGARYPLLYIPVIIDFYLSRYYYRRRFGFVYPTFHLEHE